MRSTAQLPLAAVLLALAFTSCSHAAAESDGGYGLGHAADPAEVKRLDIDVAPDGAGLPMGHGDAADGANVFALSCWSCHGTAIRLDSKRWPYATTLFDYVRRAMPPGGARRLNADELYSVVAYELYMNEVLQPHELLDKLTLPRIRMPGAGDFIEQP